MLTYLHNFSLKKKKKKTGSVARSNNIIILLSRSFPKTNKLTNKTKQIQNQKRNNSSGKMLGKVYKPGFADTPLPFDRPNPKSKVNTSLLYLCA